MLPTVAIITTGGIFMGEQKTEKNNYKDHDESKIGGSCVHQKKVEVAFDQRSGSDYEYVR